MIKDIGYLEIRKSNPGTSIQDLGRMKQTAFGVPVSGVMDLQAFNLINHILRNNPSCAVLEISQPGFHAKFDSFCVIGFAGAAAEIKKNGVLIHNPSRIAILPGDQIEVGRFKAGNILYLGIKGGFQTPMYLGSRSQYQEISETRFMGKNVKIPFFTTQENPEESYSQVKMDLQKFQNPVLEVYKGPEYQFLSLENKQELAEREFSISTLANRMAFQLEELLANRLEEMLTAPVYPGTVQLTSGGKLIVLMADAQVTGGYPRILQLSPAAISLLAQKKPGMKIKFRILDFGIED